MTSRERPPLVRGRLGTFQADQPGSPLAVTDPVQLNMFTDEETNQHLPSYGSQPNRRGQHLPLRGPTPFPRSRQSSDPPTRPVFPPLEAVSFASRCRSPPLLANFNFHPDRTSTPRLDKLDGARVCAYSYTDSPSPLYPPTMSSDHLSPPNLLQPWPRGGILKYSADHAGPRIPVSRAKPRHSLGIANRLLDPSVSASGDPSTGQVFGVRFDDSPAQHAFSAFVSVSPLSEENGHNSPHRHRSPAHPPDPVPTVLYRDLESRAGKALPSVTEPSRESRADQFSRQPWLGNGSMFDQTPREAALASNAQGREESFRAQEVHTATQPPDNHHERVDVESDELNLHSLDGSKDDWLSHRNYPLQVYLFGDEPSHRSRSSIPSYSDPMTDAECGSVYSPSIVTESEDEWQPPKRVIRVSDAAWSFNFPRDVVERSRENGRRGHVKVDSKALHRKTREQGSPKMIHTGQLDIDVTMDEAEKSEVEPIEQFSETHRSPVNPSHLDPISSMEFDTSSPVPRLAIINGDRKGEMGEGFFADGGELGFRVWREEY